MPKPTCPLCQQPFDVAAFLRAAKHYATLTDSGHSTCPACGKEMEFRIGGGRLELGYTYWAGSLHFEGVASERVPGLRQTRDERGVVFQLGEDEIVVPNSET